MRSARMLKSIMLPPGRRPCRPGREHLFHAQFFVAPLVGVGVKKTGEFIWRGGRIQSSAKASGVQPVCGRSFSWPDVVRPATTARLADAAAASSAC